LVDHIELKLHQHHHLPIFHRDLYPIRNPVNNTRQKFDETVGNCESRLQGGLRRKGTLQRRRKHWKKILEVLPPLGAENRKNHQGRLA
jgi:hypothetical protein